MAGEGSFTEWKDIGKNKKYQGQLDEYGCPTGRGMTLKPAHYIVFNNRQGQGLNGPRLQIWNDG